MRLNSRGQGRLYLFMAVILGVLIFTTVYVVGDNYLRYDLKQVALGASSNQSRTTDMVDNTVLPSWNLVAWFFIVTLFITVVHGVYTQ